MYPLNKGRHLVPRIGASVIVIAVLAGVFGYVGDRWRIGGVGPNDTTSLPPHWMFVVDRYDRHIERGQVFAFRTDRRMTRYYEEGTVFVKIAAGLPGDRVEVRTDGVYVNGVKEADGLALSKTLATEPERFNRNEVVPDGKIWALTTMQASYDSRYWGYVDQSQVVGRAHVIF